MGGEEEDEEDEEEGGLSECLWLLENDCWAENREKIQPMLSSGLMFQLISSG